MDLVTHFQMLSRYDRVANERLFAKCVQLHDVEYRKRRAGSFGSIHGLLNHILLGDRRWLGLFESGERVTPPLNQILYDDFSDLRSGRTRGDARIEAFFLETAHVACTHLFNHQTHHRGQVHVMLSQTSVGPPALDFHRIVNP